TVRVAIDLVLGDHRRPDQSPVEPVAPRVVRALDGAAQLPAPGLAELRAAVAAHVVEAAQDIVLAAAGEDALARDVVGGAGSRHLQFVGAAEVVPAPEEDPLPLELEHLGARVVGAGEGGAKLGRGGHGNETTVTCSSRLYQLGRRPDPASQRALHQGMP